MQNLGIANPREYWLHDFRRGHTQDMVAGGARLNEILKAGQWKTPAFMTYIDLHKLETSAVVEAHADESSSESSDG